MPAAQTWISLLVALGVGGALWWRLGQHARKAGDCPSWFPTLLLVGVVCRLAYLFLTPTFYAPDEQAHFNYIKFIAERGEFPILTTKLGDAGNEWEYFQPPLYYLLLTPFYTFAKLIGCNAAATVLLLRVFSFLLWLLNVWAGVILLHRLQITDRLVRVVSLGLLCLLPTYTFSSSAINNDNLLVTLGGGMLCLLANRDYGWKNALLIGLLLGGALLTKRSAVVFIPIIVTGAGLEFWQQRINWRRVTGYLSLGLGLAFLLYLPWIVRCWRIYHTLTPELLSGDLKVWPSFVHGLASSIHHLVKTFWAVSGIINDVGYPFPALGMVFLAMCLGAKLLSLRKSAFDVLNSKANQPFLFALWLGVVVNVLLVLRFGYLFGMGQGRHLFPLLMPIGLALGSWARRLSARNWEVHLAGGWMVYALSFAAYSLTKFPR
ncbi:MAG: hypothetical protein QM813_14915 [Verrucomicrobiota bacterium]